MENFNLEKYKDFVNAYDKQIGHDKYSEETILNDFLYGIGICLDEDEYSFGDGFARFRLKLLLHLNNKLKINNMDSLKSILEKLAKKKFVSIDVDMSGGELKLYVTKNDDTDDAVNVTSRQDGNFDIAIFISSIERFNHNIDKTEVMKEIDMI